MSEQFPLRERHDKRLLKEIAAAVDSYISIRPIHALISDYCAFHAGYVTTQTPFNLAVKHPFHSGAPSIAMDSEGGLVVCDAYECCLRRIPAGNQPMAHIYTHDERYLPFTCRAICADPTKPNTFYVSDLMRIYRWEFGGPHLLIAGGMDSTFNDGMGTETRFSGVTGLAIIQTGKKLYVCDCTGCRLRVVDIETREVTTIAGDGTTRKPHSLCRPACAVFYRSPNVPVDSVLFVTLNGTADDAIRRYDTLTHEITPLKLNFNIDYLWGIDCTASGILIVASTRDQRSAHHESLYAIDPMSGEVERIAGTGAMGNADGDALNEATLSGPLGLCLDQSNHCCWVVGDRSTSIRRVTLNPAFFH